MILESVEKVSQGPSRLRDLGCLAVGELVVQGLWKGQLRFQSIYIPEPFERTIREWIDVLPTCLRQDILNKSSHILFSTIGKVTEMSSSTVPIMLAAIMETLYSPSMQDVELWTDFHWHHEARLKVLHLLHSQQTTVKNLHLTCYRTPIFQFQALSFSERFLLMNVLNKFGHLQQLSVPYVADDDLLAKLGGGCCPQLESLDVQGSWEVTNQGLAAMSGQDGQMVIGRVGWVPSHFAQCGEGQKLLSNILQGSPVSASQIATMMSQNKIATSMVDTLRSLNVENTAIDGRGIETVLENFTHLQRLYADEPHWQSLLVNLSSPAGPGCRDCFPHNLPLRALNLSSNTYSLLEPLSHILPNLEHLSISNFERSEVYLDGQDNLPILHTFGKLSSLDLQDVDMEQIYHYLAQGGGQNIRCFLYKSRHRHIDLAKLDTLCPNLKELTVSDSLMVYKPGNHMVDIKSFTSLKYLTLKDVSLEGDQACWKRLIKRCSGLVRLTLQNIRMTDADMTDILSNNLFTQLEELNISSTGTINLTEESVYKLIDKCPRLRKIGGICCWSARDIVSLLDQLSCQHHFKIKMDDRE
eukprot:GFUD01107809.1.p1 GENE.GFUD01107809.1~~GFUD01107809.1.p1  ORF type:complete len:583 (+),score=150.96 GFUD01107809.1:165-1913(+)